METPSSPANCFSHPSDAGGFRITFHEVRAAPQPAPTAAPRIEEAAS